MIELLNLRGGDSFNYRLIYIVGKCSFYTSPFITITDASHNTSTWNIEPKNDFFKAFLKLKIGDNQINIKSDNCSIELTLYRKIRKDNFRHVKVFYVIAANDSMNGQFQADVDDTLFHDTSIESAKRRISLSIELLQTFISEQNYKQFKKRKTFSLYHDTQIQLQNQDDNDQLCEIFESKLNLNEALQMTPRQIYITLANEIKNNADIFDTNCKYIMILSFTRFTETMNTIVGECALGSFIDKVFEIK
jgi:hypothetical protein